jgi:hypothetical protein
MSGSINALAAEPAANPVWTSFYRAADCLMRISVDDARLAFPAGDAAREIVDGS